MAATAHVANKRTPGKLVRSAGTFHQLADGTALVATGNSGWLDIGMVKECIAHMAHVAITGTTPTMDVIIEIADDSSGTGAETIFAFGQVVGTDDNTESKSRTLDIDKRYVKATWTIAGTTPSFASTMTLRSAQDHYDTAYDIDPA